jgi:2-oxoglutarate ferredoxin oxidoreductase subunit beta
MYRKQRHIREKYIEQGMWPTIFCQGCGIGNVLNYTLRAVDRAKFDIDRTVFVSGIGCSSRLPGYVDSDGLHTTHGRSIAFATGIKLTQPDLNVIIFTGDGDLAGIGGNHFIHAARRNVDLTVICVNNHNYGMTGSQVSPTTPVGGNTTTTPYGNIESPFDLSELAIAAGASYVARWIISHPHETVLAIWKGLLNRGFSFIEIIAPCPTGYGRRNKLKEGPDYMKWLKQNTIGVKALGKMAPEKAAAARKEKMVIGELKKVDKPEFTVEWAKLVDRQFVE